MNYKKDKMDTEQGIVSLNHPCEMQINPTYLTHHQIRLSFSLLVVLSMTNVYIWKALPLWLDVAVQSIHCNAQLLEFHMCNIPFLSCLEET